MWKAFLCNQWGSIMSSRQYLNQSVLQWGHIWDQTQTHQATGGKDIQLWCEPEICKLQSAELQHLLPQRHRTYLKAWKLTQHLPPPWDPHLLSPPSISLSVSLSLALCVLSLINHTLQLTEECLAPIQRRSSCFCWRHFKMDRRHRGKHKSSNPYFWESFSRTSNTPVGAMVGQTFVCQSVVIPRQLTMSETEQSCGESYWFSKSPSENVHSCCKTSCATVG